MNEEIIETEYENIDEILEETELKAVLEGLLFVVGDDGLTIEQIEDILEVSPEEAKSLILDLKKDYENKNRGIRINYLGNSFKLTTKSEHKHYYEKLLLNGESNTLSSSAIETLAIIAYNEPITRLKVDEIRGVQSGPLVRKLAAKGLLEECGRSSEPGHPIIYKTSNEFLDYFGLKSIEDLPKINTPVKEQKEETDLYETRYKDEDII